MGKGKGKIKKKRALTFTDLEQDAKAFIECKVRVLGSVEQVKNSYRRNDLVSHYAVDYAARHFGPTGRPDVNSKTIWPRLDF